MGSRIGYHIEKDSFGEVELSDDVLWGPQTQRTLDHFSIGRELVPFEIIKAIMTVKKAAACANEELGVLSTEKKEAITKAIDVLSAGDTYRSQFPLTIWQTGSGTATNMNVNEVIAKFALREFSVSLHPNDDVNMSQSTNDVFPTAIHIAASSLVKQNVLPALQNLTDTFDRLAKNTRSIIKTGRTHLQDAAPLRLGDEFSGWVSVLSSSKEIITASQPFLNRLAIGATAVGTGLNTPKDYIKSVVGFINQCVPENEFIPHPNRFHALSSKDELVYAHGCLKTLASDLLKIANDLRMYASGPRSGIGELIIPANEPGSSIMPGKVNPTQCEALIQVCLQVLSNDALISSASALGNYQLNVNMPLIANAFIQSANLLSQTMTTFNTYCASGIIPNLAVIDKNLNNSLMLVTALNPHIGYDKSARIAKYAYENDLTLKEAAISLNIIDEETFDKLVDPKRMV